MITIHTEISCECGKQFTVPFWDGTAIPKNLVINKKCPFCGAMNTAKYVFDADFKCIKPITIVGRILRFLGFKEELHYIKDHSSLNSSQEEYFPRHCACGQEILLRQRRVL